MVKALLDLYQVDFDDSWLNWAHELQASIQEQFVGNGKTYAHAPLQTALLPPFQDFTDHGELPGALSVCISNLLTLNALTGNEADLKAS